MANKLKILLSSPGPNFAGGIARWTKHILNYSKNDSHCEIVFLTQNEIPPRAKRNIFNRLLMGVLNYAQVINKYKTAICKEKFNVVHITTSASISLLKDIILLKLAKKKGIRSIIHFRFGRIPELAQSKNWEWKLLTKVIHLADTAITIDLASYKTLQKKGFQNVKNLPNPLSDEILTAIDNNTEKKPRSIIFVGQMLKTKGIYELVEVCSKITDIKLSMYGITPPGVKNELLTLAGKNHEQWLNIAGEVDYSTIPNRMSQAGIFVLPTYTEGFPNVILESMACGCPIIASRVGAIPEMLNVDADEPCGICVTPKNKNELKNKIEYLLNNPHEAQILGSRAKKRVVAEYSMDSIWKQLIKIWTNSNKIN